MKQFITILLISLCFAQLTFGRISKECVDSDAACNWGDFSKTNHSVDDDSAIVCDGEAIFGQFGDNGPNKCYGIFDGCFGKGEDEKNQVTCTAVEERCEVNSLADSTHANCDTSGAFGGCDAEDPCGTAIDASSVPCCVGYSKPQMEAACTAWQDSFHCAPSAAKILIFILVLSALGSCLGFNIVNSRRKKARSGSAGGPGGSGYVEIRGRRGRVNF